MVKKDTIGMVFHESRFGRDFFAPDEPGVHVGMDDHGFFVRWQFESGDSMMSDESLAGVCKLSKEEYAQRLIALGAQQLKYGVYFNNREDCQKAVDELVAPAVLADVMGRKRNETA